ncbi:uncharacterized protein LOC134197571 [Corticium candelabrum]|uniref:uncharacterized protein LOC134197571 n=1 Tax=Corticium candelabrum TaxID=121492 RepID=UPI002E2527F8|nr:uncharacterized protein LOC134197571 [Corticium candelabrum]
MFEPQRAIARNHSQSRLISRCEYHVARYLAICQFGTGAVILALGYILTLKEPKAITLGTVDVRPFYRCYWPSFLLFFVATLCVVISSTFKRHDAPFYFLVVFFVSSVVVMVTCLAVGFLVALMASHLSAYDLENCITLSVSTQGLLYMEYGPVCLCSPQILNGTLPTVKLVDLFAFSSDCHQALSVVAPLLKAASCAILVGGVEVMLSTLVGRFGFSFTKRRNQLEQQDQQNS